MIQLEHACCTPFIRQISQDAAIQAGELRVSLDPRPARLRVDGNPVTRVTVGGKVLGTAGESQRAPLPVPIPAGGETPYEGPARVLLEVPGPLEPQEGLVHQGRGVERDVAATRRQASPGEVPELVVQDR